MADSSWQERYRKKVEDFHKDKGLQMKSVHQNNKEALPKMPTLDPVGRINRRKQDHSERSPPWSGLGRNGKAEVECRVLELGSCRVAEASVSELVCRAPSLSSLVRRHSQACGSTLGKNGE